MSNEIVRGEGHAPGQNPGEPMPTVPKVERGSLGDMAEHFRRKNEEAASGGPRRQAPPAQQQTAKSRIGAFSERLEARQEAPTLPGTPRDQQQHELLSDDPDVRKQQKGKWRGAPETPPDPVQGGGGGAEPEQPATEGAEAVPEEGADDQQPLIDELDDVGAAEKYREWQTSDLFPEEMADKWLHEIKVAGQLKYVDTKELRQGYARGGDSRRMYAEAQQIQRQAQEHRAAIDQHFEAIKEPTNMLEILERNGYGDTLEKVARMIAERVSHNRRVVRAAGYAAMEQHNTQDANDHRVQEAMRQTEAELKRVRGVDIESRRLQFERQQFDQTRQQQTHQQATEQYRAQYENQLNQLRPNAFRAYGIKDTATNRQAVLRHLANVIQTTGFEGQITRDHVMSAAADLRDELDDTRATEQGGNGHSTGALSPAQWRAQQQVAAARSRAANGNGRPLPPGRLGMGNGKPLGGAGAKRGSLSDLEAMVHKSRTGGQ